MDAPANNVFSGPITSTFSAIPFDKSHFTCQCEKEDRKAKGFQILRFDWSFSSDIIAVKGLTHISRDFFNTKLPDAKKGFWVQTVWTPLKNNRGKINAQPPLL